jgi:serine/threonine protein kinase/Tol biopolymer transport system component
MEPQRWKEIDRVFAAALERDSEERPAFLTSACGGDQQLRAEVESLLAHVTPESFFDGPVVEEAARLLASERREPELTSIGPYQVVKLLGAGGMGKVYLAYDPRLNRQVAVKLLSRYGVDEEERSKRFRQEALAASALNHPNILTIHEIGEFEGQDYIATEFIDGVTLRARLGAGEMPLAMAIDNAIQVGVALSAAHEAAIVHRDIKPENVMIRADGLVKTLDFGIAKQTPTDGRPGQNQLETKPGSVVGTAPYMSPEQANGLPVDARSDIWSLGVLLYEMVTGRVPFMGKTATETISLILQKEPAPLASHALEVPAELERIVTRALTKDRDERYQTMKDMLNELSSLKRKREVDAAIERTVSPDLRRRESTGSVEPTQATASLAVAAIKTDDAQAEFSRTISASGARARLRRMGVAALLVAAVAATTLGIYWLFVRPPREKAIPRVPFHEMNISRLTTSGKITHAALSPDGKYVADVTSDAEGDSVWVRNIAAPTNMRIAGPAASEYVWVTFAPDGDSVYYLALDRDKGDTDLYRVPLLGGPPSKVAVDIGPVAFSPDGRRITFVSMDKGESSLVVADADRRNGRKLATRRQPDLFRMTWNAPAWSPDGKTIACQARLNEERGSYETILSVSLDGTQKALTSRHWQHVGQPVWLANGSGLLVTASESATTPEQVWYIALSNGETTRVTHDLNDYHDLSLAGNSRRLAVVQDQSVSSIWVAPNADAGRAQQIASDTSSSEDVAWTPEGRIVYRSNVGDSAEIWVMNADGSNAKQVTSGARVSGGLTVSPDGHNIFFTSDRAGHFNIWRVDADGTNLKQLTSGQGEFYPQSTPDGHWIVFQGGDVYPTLWKVPAAGGEVVEVARTRVLRPAVSPDGQMVAYDYLDSDLDKWGIGIVSFPGGSRVTRFDFPPTVSSRFVRWSPDRQSIAFVNSPGGVSDIWLQPISGGTAKQLTSFKAEEILAFDWSRDGRSLALVRGVKTSDVVLIEEGQK